MTGPQGNILNVEWLTRVSLQRVFVFSTHKGFSDLLTIYIYIYICMYVCVCVCVCVRVHVVGQQSFI